MPSYLTARALAPNIAAIDLGSNALRAIVARPVNGHIDIIQEVREPLRLGEDVFHLGMIGPRKIEEMENSFIRLLHIFAAHGVVNVKAIATSAMRDATNAQHVIDRIERLTSIRIEPITGLQEAKLIYRAVQTEIDFGKRNVVLVDVGGGSTEIMLIRRGKLVASKSFNVGTVRLVRVSERRELDTRIAGHVKEIVRFAGRYLPLHKIDAMIGTGGNLRRMGKIRRRILGKSAEECLYPEIAHMADTLFGMGLIERVRRLELDPNRADVILPATMLIKGLMEGLDVERIMLPTVGLKEGVILSMLDKKKRHFTT